jgi:hypothetical protein
MEAAPPTLKVTPAQATPHANILNHIVTVNKFVNKLTFAFMMYVIILIVGSVVLMMFDHTHFSGLDKEKKKNSSVLQRFFDRFYFISTTISSVGYGDIYPISNITKMIVIIVQSMAAFGVMSLLI